MSTGLDTETPSLDLAGAQIRQWIRDSEEVLQPYRSSGHHTLEQEVERDRGLLRLLFDAGWTRSGWPRFAGGAGGDERSRAVLYDVLAQEGIALPEAFIFLETLAPVLVKYAPALATRHLPPYLRGDELWGQGFSEPDAGSDLAAIRTRAISEPGGYRLTGSKIWTSLGHLAQWAVVLCRSDGSVRGHRGLSMLWVDLGAAGVEVRPITAANGRNEFAEMSFDDVVVPESHLIGSPGEGWDIAMYLLQYERGMYAWLRQAELHRVLEQALQAAASPSRHAIAAVGTGYAALCALRARSSRTVSALAAGEMLGPKASVDKILLSRAEQLVYDALRLLAPVEFLMADDDSGCSLRDRWFYSRATSIFGGAVDIQRGIVAERVLALPRGSRSGR